MKTDYTNYAPRLGASYRVSDQTVVRAGYGVSYLPVPRPGYFSDFLSLFKSFPIYQAAIEASFDAFNLTNTPAFALPNSSFGKNPGLISSTLGSGVGNINGVGGPRVLQAGVKLTF